MKQKPPHGGGLVGLLSFWGGLVGLLITPLFSPQNSLFFPSKLTEFYIANRHNK